MGFHRLSDVELMGIMDPKLKGKMLEALPYQLGFALPDARGGVKWYCCGCDRFHDHTELRIPGHKNHKEFFERQIRHNYPSGHEELYSSWIEAQTGHGDQTCMDYMNERARQVLQVYNLERYSETKNMLKGSTLRKYGLELSLIHI